MFAVITQRSSRQPDYRCFGSSMQKISIHRYRVIIAQRMNQRICDIFFVFFLFFKFSLVNVYRSLLYIPKCEPVKEISQYLLLDWTAAPGAYFFFSFPLGSFFHPRVLFCFPSFVGAYREKTEGFRTIWSWQTAFTSGNEF